ncbi:MAG: DUF1350 family protein [Elainellaceae cyanobacterium]
MKFKAIAHSWVAEHPKPVGVIEFLGGALYGTLPTLSYRHFLHSLYQSGYTIIAIPFPFGFGHESIAKSLLRERQQIRAELNYSADIPDFWVGHSLGCKYITLLEVYGAILGQPSLLMAPDISDTKDALPFSTLAQWLDRFYLGVQPTRQDTQTLVRQSNLFNLTALISFAQDDLAGTASQSPETSDVAWFIQELQSRSGDRLIAQEIPGGHREPVGIQMGDVVLRPDFQHGIFEPLQNRQLERLAIELLAKLAQRLSHIERIATKHKSEQLQEV